MKFICMAANYRGREAGTQECDSPVFFMKPETSLLRNHCDFYVPDFQGQVACQAGVVIKIGKICKAVSPRFASRYYDEVTVGLDITPVDLFSKCRAQGLPWFICKGFDSSAPLGDMVPKDSLPSQASIGFALKVNGQAAIAGNTSSLVWSIDEIVAKISSMVTLKQGDLIYTGSPAQSVQLKIGDRLEAELEGRNLLEIKVK